MRSESEFGALLKTLIKDAGMTQTQFYLELGIKKPYFYDIVSGRVNPPPKDLQFKALGILKTDAERTRQFFDLAAKARGDVPADITKWVEDDPNAVTAIRQVMNK